MRALTIVVSDEMYQQLEMEAGDSTPSAVGLVAAQMIEWAIQNDEGPAAPAA